MSSTLPDEIERLAKEASEAKAKLDDYERQHGKSWRRRNLWKLAESRLNELIADNAPEIAARLRREERLEAALKNLVKHADDYQSFPAHSSRQRLKAALFSAREALERSTP